VLFVTGTGTDVGKTVVSAALAALGLQRGTVAVVKPGQTGVRADEPGDLAEVARLAGPVACHELVRYPSALAPAAAARLDGREPLDPARLYDLLLGLREDLVLVEGAGGLLVRYDEDGLTLADMARALRARVLVVVDPALGTLNATALTLEALAHRGVELEGLVLGRWPAVPGLAERSNLRDLEMLAARPLLGAMPAGAPSATDFLEVAGTSLSPQLGGTWDARAFRSQWDPPAAR
jgi:dethiobiotin synthetase